MRRAAWIGALGVLLTIPARAQSPALQAVERAYQSVDFPATHALAERALRAGAASHAQTLRLYVLLGISAAALGDPEEAKQDFVMALAVDPGLKLDKALSPKMREPYLEARGYWAAAPEHLAIAAKPSPDLKHLDVSLVDPRSLVASVELGLAAVGASPRAKHLLESKRLTRFAIPLGLDRQGFDFTLRALDRYGNVLAERGTDSEPERVLPAANSPIAGGAAANASATQSYLWPVLFGAGALVAGGAGAAFQLQRESAAREWNGPGCENKGQTRLDQCRSLDARRERSEHWAIGLYGASGALLTASVIALISGRPPKAGPSSNSAAAWNASSKPTGLLSCSFFASGVRCDGRF